MGKVFFILQSAFSLWMLVDAIQRSARSYWYFVVLMPFGEFVYFFKVKIHDPEFEPIRRFFKGLTTKKVTVDELRFVYDQTPSFENKLNLAREFFNRELFREAAEIFAEAHALNDDSRDALYGLGLTQMRLDEHGAAIESLRRLIELDAAFDDYSPWADLAHALDHNGQRGEALEVLDRLVIKSPRLNHYMLYALFLRRDGQLQAARDQLETGLREHDLAPKYLKLRNRPWVRHAKQMLREMSAEATRPAAPPGAA